MNFTASLSTPRFQIALKFGGFLRNLSFPRVFRGFHVELGAEAPHGNAYYDDLSYEQGGLFHRVSFNWASL